MDLKEKMVVMEKYWETVISIKASRELEMFKGA